MIIRSRWRRAGGLATHLGRTDSNEAVAVRGELCRGMPNDIGQALTLATSISRTNGRVSRDFIHIKISPAKHLTDEGLTTVLALIEREHAISPRMPRLVVEHRKGDRAPHFHVVFPVVDTNTGRAVRSHENYLHDEIASRLAELALGEPLVPGSHHRGVIAELDQRGLNAEAKILAGKVHVMPGRRLANSSRLGAEALGQDADQMASIAFEIWQSCGGDPRTFEGVCHIRGYAIAQGDRALLLLHRATGAHVPLARALRRKAKQGGAPIELRERDLSAAFANAPTLVDARQKSLAAESEKAKAAVDRELARLQQEASRDGQSRLAERLQRLRNDEKRKRREKMKATLKARRREIQDAYARRDRIRRARVSRSFAAAGIADRSDLRNLVFKIAGAAVLLAGGGLGLALVAAGLAVTVMPSRERARAAAFQAALARADDQEATRAANRQAYDDLAAQQRVPKTIDFKSIAKRQRGLAGAFAHLVLDKTEHGLSPAQESALDGIRLALGEQAERLENAVRHGTGRGVLSVLAWYDHHDVRHRQAVAATWKHAGATKAKRFQTGRAEVNPDRIARERD